MELGNKFNKSIAESIAELNNEREYVTRRYEEIMNQLDKREGLKHIYLAGVIAELNNEQKVNGYIFTMCYKDKSGKQHHVSQKFEKYETAKAVFDVMNDLVKGTISWIDVREAE